VDPCVRDGRDTHLLEPTVMTRVVLPPMLAAGRRCAQPRADDVRAEAIREMRAQLGHELHRLRGLQALHGHVRAEEVEMAEAHRLELEQVLGGARLRLDAARVIWKGPLAGIREWIGQIEAAHDLPLRAD
jgi:hypothetical protein